MFCIHENSKKKTENEWMKIKNKKSSFCQWFTKFKSINDDDVITTFLNWIELVEKKPKQNKKTKLIENNPHKNMKCQ